MKEIGTAEAYRRSVEISQQIDRLAGVEDADERRRISEKISQDICKLTARMQWSGLTEESAA